jgi:hypothetical protein
MFSENGVLFVFSDRHSGFASYAGTRENGFTIF